MIWQQEAARSDLAATIARLTLALLSASYGLFILPESLPPGRRDVIRWRKANPIGSLELLGSHRAHGPCRRLLLPGVPFYLAAALLVGALLLALRVPRRAQTAMEAAV